MAFDSVRRDVGGAVRGLVSSPAFACAVLVTLALGIGATSAIFTVARAVLLRPLPYSAPDSRVMIWSRWVSFDKTWVSDAEVLDYRRESQALGEIAAWTTGAQNLSGDAGEPMRIGVGLVTPNAFDVLGARPILGRTLSAEEGRPGAAPAAVLGYDLWQTRFGADADIVGRTIQLDNVSVLVVGVMPQGFRLPTDFTVDAAEPTALWRALSIDERNAQRGSHGYYAAGVLEPGYTAAMASEELGRITARLTQQGFYPAAQHFTAFAVSLDEEIRGSIRPAIWLLGGAVAFLLLIACTNVANLLLARGDTRTRELAVRTALGAAPGRLVRQLLTESVVLAAGGAVLGLGLAAAGLSVLASLDPTSLPAQVDLALDSTVVLFTILLAVATTVVFGLTPALRSRRVEAIDALRDGMGRTTAGRGRQRLRTTLVVTEVALAVVLVIGAGLMIRTLGALSRIDLGFVPDHVLTLRVALPRTPYDTPERVVSFYDRLVDRVRQIPDVSEAGIVRALPLATTIGDWGLDVEGYEEAPGRSAKGDWQVVSDGAFEALGVRLLAGRWFDAGDDMRSAPVAVVNETFARTYWSDMNAVVGGRIRLGASAERPWATVVGIVADERHNGVTGLIKEKFYIPHAQWHVVTGGNVVRSVFLVVRTGGDPLAAAAPVRNVVRELDPATPVASVKTMDDVVAASLATPRLTGFLLSTFAGVALVLAAVGIHGVLAYVVAERRREIGIRLALGAERHAVLRMVAGRGLGMAAVGIVCGAAAALVLTRLMAGLLYEVEPADPVTFAAVSALLLFVSFLAGYVPARRATRVSPATPLRME